jgi:hypothetical protein
MGMAPKTQQIPESCLRGVAAIEAESKLVQVGLKMLSSDAAMMCLKQPGVKVGEDRFDMGEV